jgi:hypothetical protein
MDYILIDSNKGNPQLVDNFKAADWLVLNAASMDDFELAIRVGREDEEHTNSKRILRCVAEVRTRYIDPVPGDHRYARTEAVNGYGRTRARRDNNAWFVITEADGIEFRTPMEAQHAIWHVWVDYFLREDPIAIWIAHARPLAKYFVNNMSLPVEEAEAQKYEHMGKAAERNIEHRTRTSLKENGSNGNDDAVREGKLVLNDWKTGDEINVGELPSCDIKVHVNRNWEPIKKWNPKDAYIVQDFLAYRDSNYPITLI